MNELISELGSAREKLLSVIDKVPENKRYIRFLGTWSLKDIVAHLIGWSEHQIDTLRSLSKGEIPSRPTSSSDFNDANTKAHENQSWEQVHSDFVKSSLVLIEEYKNLPQSLSDKQIWPDKQMVPKEYIRLEINHYSREHLLQIKRLLEE